jgi:hypothetical protein
MGSIGKNYIRLFHEAQIYLPRLNPGAPREARRRISGNPPFPESSGKKLIFLAIAPIWQGTSLINAGF